MPKRRNSKKGGTNYANPATYSSAATYALATAGNANTQYNNVFEIGKNNHHGNGLVGLQGQTVGGRRNRSMSKSKSKKRKQKGGFWGGLISTAITPFALLAMQQTFRRKKGGSKTRRRN